MDLSCPDDHRDLIEVEREQKIEHIIPAATVSLATEERRGDSNREALNVHRSVYGAQPAETNVCVDGDGPPAFLKVEDCQRYAAAFEQAARKLTESGLSHSRLT